MNKADADILAQVRAAFGNAPPARLGVAVSGGGDSIALLHILSRCFVPGSVELFAVTVDHGLRPEAREEAVQVKALCANLMVPHTTLRWTSWDGVGNLQERAREARYQLISEWAKTQDIAVFAVGHTADDQAETMLMRLARTSGVDGLAAMPLNRTIFGITLVRPLLGVTRQELRAYLNRHEVDWVEDPSNENAAYERVRTREALKLLAPLGITAKVLSGVAGNMEQAREALDWYTFLAARDLAVVNGGDVIFDLRQFRALPGEIARRLLVRSVAWIGGTVRGPRRTPVNLTLESIRAGRSSTLGGCNVLRHDNRVWVCREYKAIQSMRCSIDASWDHRWQLVGPDVEGLEARALGQEGLKECPDWRATGRPLASLIASPAVWRGDLLIAAPLAGKAAGWTAQLVAGEEEFFATLISH
ncbi:tRNA lysidine(34) synthetase TilS [Sedimentitalea todarodis]|uniref:tRNA(Ile)-lysidine synthase n=1 Tax=Sedimentitalea todarodis TaxID=1631240 RepID=A0ABU3V8U1_9RHOB|nr:tRNA lysidine(34) synthetase TilS [Sedimentitalea todarodis]MDU9002455.1 tRNA lysidine(34) synthetase TilS [Sedimentitalea todarodis]